MSERTTSRSKTLIIGAQLLAGILVLWSDQPAGGQSQEQPDRTGGREIDGLVIERRKYSFIVKGRQQDYSVSIPNGTPFYLRLVRPELDLEQRQLRMTLPISAADGDAANNKVLVYELPQPLYLHANFKDADSLLQALAQPQPELLDYTLSSSPTPPAIGKVILSGELTQAETSGLVTWTTGEQTRDVRLAGRRGLFSGFSILDLEPDVTSVFVEVQEAEGGLYATSIQFAPQGNPLESEDSTLPRCLFLGDSVSFNYQRPLREALAGKVNLHHPPGSCGGSKNFRLLHHWLGNYESKGLGWDVIVFNFGLHDAETQKLDYQSALRDAISRLKRTGAKLVWITTTPIDYGFNGNGKSAETVPMEQRQALRRDAADPIGLVPGRMKLQNQWASEVLAGEPDIAVCDLWQLVKDGHEGLYSDWWYSKNYNFSYAQSVPLARLLARSIVQSLGLAADGINPPESHSVKVPEEYK